LPIYRSAVHQFDSRLRAIRPEQWSASTPDDAWDVKRLVQHVVLGQQLVPATLDGSGAQHLASGGSTGPTEQDAPDPARHPASAGPDGSAEQDAPDLVRAWDLAAGSAVRAISGLDSWDRRVTLPDGDVTADEYLWRLATDLTVHAWDLARAIGAPDEFPNDLLANVLDQAKHSADRWFTAERYAPSIPVPGCTDDLTELLALTGRNRWWRRS
jgi:uncharacterized protein (TIGR03083 family)